MISYNRQLYFDQKWEEKFKLLLQYRDLYGTTNVPNRFREKNIPPLEKKLSGWVRYQRTCYRAETLADWRHSKLVSVDFDFAPLDTIFEDRFADLLKYKEKHGHVLVGKHDTEYNGLCGWVAYLRREPPREDHKKRLDDIGFVWSVLNENWQNKFRKVAEFKQIHGHFRIADCIKDSRELVSWVYNQRRSKLDGDSKLLTNDKINLLDSIGFIWEFQNSWEEHFDDLIEFYNKHGHFRVPYRINGSRELSAWVYALRKTKKDGDTRLLTKDKINLLDSLGFIWEKPKSKWDKYITHLLEFHSKNGHCNVPLKYDEIKGLGTWVYAMRKRKDTLTQEKVERLDSLGFNWELDPTEKYYHSLTKFL